MLAPIVGFGDSLGFGRTEGVSVFVQKCFQQIHHGGQLAGIELA